MEISRIFINEVTGDMQNIKTLGLAVYLKFILQNSMFKHFSMNKLADHSKVSYKTLRKYLPLLEEKKLIHYEGRGKNTILVINRLSSHFEKRNFTIDILKKDSFKETVKSLRAFIVMRLQAKKDYIRQLLQIYHNPRKCDNFKAVRRKVRRLVKAGVLKDPWQKYVEKGLGLRKVAKEVGCCVVTALKTVNYAIGNGWLSREHHYEQVYAKGVNYLEIYGYTFTTKNNMYIVHANTYTLSSLARTCFPQLSA